MSEQSTGTAGVQSLARGLQVISSFDAEHASMTLSEVAARTGLSRATARRFLLTCRIWAMSARTASTSS